MLFIKKFLKNENGTTAIEYGLTAALIVIAVMAGVSSLGASQKDRYDKIAARVLSATR